MQEGSFKRTPSNNNLKVTYTLFFSINPIQVIQHFDVSAVMEFETAVHAADGGGAEAGLGGNIRVDHVALQHLGRLHPSGHLQKLGGGAEILEKLAAILHGLQGQNTAV